MKEITCSAKRRADIAMLCGVVDAYLYQIFTRRKMAGAALCVAIERASGGQISRKDLRPEDWHLIWPELVDIVLPAPGSATAGQRVAHA